MAHYDWLHILVLTFKFSECSTGIYGVNFESRCDTYVNRICDRFDGSCKYGCIVGIKGDRCNFTGITTSLKRVWICHICNEHL